MDEELERRFSAPTPRGGSPATSRRQYEINPPELNPTESNVTSTSGGQSHSLICEYNSLPEEITALKPLNSLLPDIPFSAISIGPCVGAGGFGEVFRAQWHSQNVAVKRIKVADMISSRIDDWKRECQTVMRLHHKHIVLSLGTTVDHINEDNMLVMEFMEDGSLHDMLFKQKVKLTRAQVTQLALDVAKGLNYLHNLTPKIIHRDLKCANILLYNNQTRAKISDFGTARYLNQDSVAKTFQGTVGYFAPEMFEDEHDEKADVYSFGIVMLVLATPTCTLPTTRDQVKLHTRVNSILDTSPCLANDAQYRQLVLDCCQISPDARPSMGQCVEVLKSLREAT